MLPRWVFEELLTSRKPITTPKGWKIYRYIDYSMGVHVTCLPAGIAVECNPTSFVVGNNAHQIDRQGLVLFEQALSERYQPLIPFAGWRVTLFDFNADIQTDHTPATYFPHLVRLKNYEPRPYEGGVNFSTSNKAITLYDWNLHATTEEEKENKIRVEASFNGGLPQIKSIRNMSTLNDYTKPKNYAKLPQLWLELFEQIEKRQAPVMMPELTHKEVLILADVERFTLAGLKNKMKVDNPNNYRRQFAKVVALLDRVQECSKQHSIFNPTDELTSKVRAKANELILSV